MADKKTNAPEPGEQDTEVTQIEQQPDAAPAETEAETPAETPSTIEVTVRVAISGLRDGQPWPRIGEKLTLPTDEAKRYAAFGYVEL